ncbi:patatin-like phospholipase family protein [Cupriavidus pinatubonensis]|uniref:patatin-like phospholipase family protein n=1 Tax=Cupriavidus pinatubonensis TaxID=248026 RepID=UPI001FD50B1F|nr:patatin-like phospholipase family protein [Cupriavidus pinatubonensis]
MEGLAQEELAPSTTEANEEADPFQEEKDLINVRRRAPQGMKVIDVRALALSGGGIRRATFSLGVMRGMAKQNTFHLFDYLSTVSGGGYVGAALGRLYGKGAGASKVEACLSDDASMFLWWLRNNGRYLVPQGAKDTWLVMSAMLRGWLSSQFSFLLLALLAVVAIMLPHVVVWAHLVGSGCLDVVGKVCLAGTGGRHGDACIRLHVRILPAGDAATRTQARRRHGHRPIAGPRRSGVARHRKRG